MGVSSLQQTQDLSYPLQDQSIFSPDTSVNQSLHTILPISDDTPKKVRFETLKAHDAPINYRSKFQNSLVGVGVLLAIAITAIDMYVQETWVSGIISIICAVVMITAFWMHLFEDNTFSQNESRKMHRMITFLLYSAFLLSLAASILAMVNIVKVYKAGDSTVTEQSSINSISDSSNSTDSTSGSNLEYSIHNRTHGVLESNYDSFGAFLNANPVLIAMIVVESVQFLLYCVLIWNTWSFGKVLDRMQELMDALNKNKSNVKEVELKTFSQASDLVVTY